MLLQGFLLPIILSCWETAGENIETLVIVSVPYCFQVSGLRSKSMVTFFLNLNGIVLNEGNAVNRWQMLSVKNVLVMLALSIAKEF